jgi:hypothetical protein
MPTMGAVEEEISSKRPSQQTCNVPDVPSSDDIMTFDDHKTDWVLPPSESCRSSASDGSDPPPAMRPLGDFVEWSAAIDLEEATA